ncbi:SCO4225 family membrane protein [Streptomyces sp. NPDC018833]|uniref:SCO4225 family membrane protein n=1 Tax=Streptomyces sp. NPDC018833 TaxID=3365053 RepID=UPI0037B8DF9C
MHARLTSLARLTFGNPASRIYLALVVAAALFVAVDTLFVHHEDASMAGIWLFLLTAPTIFALMALGTLFGEGVAESAGFLYPALVLAVLVQACALGLFVRLLGGGPHTAHPHGA